MYRNAAPTSNAVKRGLSHDDKKDRPLELSAKASDDAKVLPISLGPIDTEVDPFGRKRSYAFTPSYLDYLPESKRPRHDVNGEVVAIQQASVVRRETPTSKSLGPFKSMETLAVEVNTGSTTKTSELRATTYSGGDVARNFLSSLSSPELIQSTAVPRVRREQRVFTQVEANIML